MTIRNRIFVTYLILIAIIVLYIGFSGMARSMRVRVELDHAAILETRISWGATRMLLGDMIINWDNGAAYRQFLDERTRFDQELTSLHSDISSRWYYPDDFKDLFGGLDAVWAMANAHLDRVAAVVEHADFAQAEALVRDRPGLQRLNHLWSELMLRDTVDSRRLAHPIQLLISEVEFFPIYGAKVEQLFAILAARADETKNGIVRIESAVRFLFFISFLTACLFLASRFAHSLSLPIIRVARQVYEFAGLAGTGPTWNDQGPLRNDHSLEGKDGDELELLSQTVDRMIQHYTDLSERAGQLARGEVSSDTLQFPREGVVGRSLDEIARYLHELAHTSAWIRDGEYGMQIQERSSTDVITHNFNVMSAVIQQKISTLRNMFEAVDEAVIVIDGSGSVAEVNSQLYRLIGVDAADTRSQNFITDQVVSQLQAIIAQDPEGEPKTNFYTNLGNIQGHEVPVKLNARRLAGPGQEGVQWMFIITNESWRARARREREHLRSQAVMAELRALRAQINPHFFFNTLNTIAHLAETNPGAAVDTVEQLAELFRYALTATRREVVPFADEMQHIQRFLDIERRRYGDSLRVAFDVDDRLAGHPIPPMLLQPLVENAVRYGGNDAAEIQINITARQVEDGMVVEIADQGSTEVDPESLFNKPGIGIRNVNQRFSVIYGRPLEFARNKPQGLIVRMHIPGQLS
ncbi:MAG: histidine kinase [Spirochaetia bacterium]|jgi:PAS domain S-box-containing protein|nr:histidine kinase [Spirochaetia bacterium]